MEHGQELVLVPPSHKVFATQAMPDGLGRGAQERNHRVGAVFSRKLLQTQHPDPQQAEAAVPLLEPDHTLRQGRPGQTLRRNPGDGIETSVHQRSKRFGPAVR